MIQIENDRIKPMLLDILKEIDRYTRENGLRYWLISGTLLGAVRHGGFIPWDDDIDIWMPRPDYERLLKEFDHGYYKVISAHNDRNYPLDYAKVHDTRTLVVEEGGDGEWGISVDIFPLDGLPSVPEAKRMFEKTRRFRRLIANQRFTRKGRICRSNGLAKNVSVILGRMMHPFLTLNGLLLRIDRMMQKYDFDSCDYCGCLCWREITISKAMVETSYMKFEDGEFAVPKDYDSILRLIFGDYMQLPPEEQRVSNHGIKAYWK